MYPASLEGATLRTYQVDYSLSDPSAARFGLSKVHVALDCTFFPSTRATSAWADGARRDHLCEFQAGPLVGMRILLVTHGDGQTDVWIFSDRYLQHDSAFRKAAGPPD